MLTLRSLLILQATPRLPIKQTELDAEAQLHLVNEIQRSVAEGTASGLLVWIALTGVFTKFHHVALTGDRTGNNVQFRLHMDDGTYGTFTMGDEVKLIEDLAPATATAKVVV